MALNINTNLNSLVAASNLSKLEQMTQRSVGRLSSGLRIYSAADDAAGLSISEKMRARLRSLNQAQRNANTGITLAAAADYDAVIGAVAHDLYRGFDGARLGALVRPGGLVADVKGMWRALVLADGLRRWQL